MVIAAGIAPVLNTPATKAEGPPPSDAEVAPRKTNPATLVVMALIEVVPSAFSATLVTAAIEAVVWLSMTEAPAVLELASTADEPVAAVMMDAASVAKPTADTIFELLD